MIRPVVKDVLKLSIKSVDATNEDKNIASDLIDTLNANKDNCIGMAANMIGINKRIIVVNMGLLNLIMYNPIIKNKKGGYRTEEGCLSLIGLRSCIRHDEITVEYYDKDFKKCVNTFNGLTAEIIEHECDHLEGIII